ncbi:MAG TPA: RsmB/NOP family class I SAM-dependent RNA methyltransferase [Saprospiraceae bacterium]|nr:RsmB/NOP family class I SAM-dependent RNA methyltransferase [Saprospiraceae bacterium]
MQSGRGLSSEFKWTGVPCGLMSRLPSGKNDETVRAKIARLHRPLVLAVVSCLDAVFRNHKPADRVLEKCFKDHPGFGKRDRSFIAEHVYDITRNYLLIASAFPQYVDFWEIFGAWLVIQGRDLPDWREFDRLHQTRIGSRIPGLVKNPALKYSIPPELDAYGHRALGDRWYAEMAAMHQAAPLVIRVNTLKSNPMQVMDFFREQQVPLHLIDPSLPEALQIDQRINLFATRAFREGWIEIQDYSSQQVAHFIRPDPGMRLIDACAGGGGKSLHLAARMANKGRIISLDIEEYKLKNLKARAKRAGAGIIESRLIENNKIIKRLESSADAVLLDVPCSGSGVLRRNPDAKYRITPDYIAQLVAKQKDILASYCKMVMPGGLLFYVTCSLFPEENEIQVHNFLTEHEGFELIEDRHLWPSECGYDSFYMAKIKRREGAA